MLYWIYGALFQRRYSGSVYQKLERNLRAIDSKYGVESLLVVLKEEVMNYKSGELGLSIDSIEGRLAYKIYDKELGDSVFRRINPIAGILICTDICENKKRYLTLVN